MRKRFWVTRRSSCTRRRTKYFIFSKEESTMKWFINLSTRTKLILGFGAMWLLLGVVIVTAYVGITEVTQSEQELHDIHFADALNLRQLRADQNYQQEMIL